MTRRATATPALITRLRVACGSAVAVCLAWALWPLGSTTAAPPVAAGESAATTSLALAPLDLVAFNAPLWVIPAPPPAPPAPPPPPPPLKLQLIAIVAEQTGVGGSERPAALLYDPDQDKLFTVHEGDTLQGRRIEKVTDARVHIRDQSGERILSLRSDPAGAGGGAAP